MNEFKDIGTRLRQARKNKKITAKQLGKMLGLSEDMICKIERGEKNLQPKYRGQLNKILDIDVFEHYSNNNALISMFNSLKKILIFYNLTNYELEYVKLSLEVYYGIDDNKTIEEKKDKLYKMYGYGKPKGDIDNVVYTAISFLNQVLSNKKIYKLEKRDLYNIINSLSATELINSNVIPVYNASTFFPYLDNIHKNITTDYYFLHKDLANDKYEYIGLKVTEFILETKTSKYKPFDIIVLRLDKELHNGTDILISHKKGMFIKNLRIEGNMVILSNPSELNPEPKKCELEKFKKMINSFEINIVGTIVDIFVSKKSSYDFEEYKYYFPKPSLSDLKEDIN